MTISHMLCNNCSCTFAVTDEACSFCGSNDAASVPAIEREPYSISLTYGQLPREVFDRAWAENMQGTKSIFEVEFSIERCKRVGTRTFTKEQLFEELRKAIAEYEGAEPSFSQEQRDAAGDWASCVLSVLGIEWV